MKTDFQQTDYALPKTEPAIDLSGGYASCLRLPLKTKWFNMTKAKIKMEDYREINEYWIKRLIFTELELSVDDIMSGLCALRDGYNEDHVYDVYGFCFKNFDCNVMTLGYPKSGNLERTLTLKHKGIEIRSGNPEWGAEPEKIYFVIMHGDFPA